MALANDGLPSNVLKCIPDALWKGVNGMKKKLIKRINEIPRTVQAYSCECDVKHGCESGCSCPPCGDTGSIMVGQQGLSNNTPIRLSALQSVSISAQR